MRRLLALTFIILLSATQAEARLNDLTPPHRIKTLEQPTGIYKYIDQELLVQPRDGVLHTALGDIVSFYGAHIERTDDVAKYGFALVILPASTDLMLIKEQLSNNPNIKTVNLNYVGGFATEDPYFANQWALRNIEAPRGWNAYPQGVSPVVVAILDSGYFGHEEVSSTNPRIIQNEYEYNFTDTLYYGDDADHATGIDLPPLNSSTRRVKISGKMRPGRLTHACDAIHGRADNRDPQRS
jgi:hypothetical protein